MKKVYDNQWIIDAMNGVPVKDTENEIRRIQDDIIRIKKEKNMYPDMNIVREIVKNNAWKQDRIEKIRDNKGG